MSWLKQSPQVINADFFKYSQVSAGILVNGKLKWVPARPLSGGGLITRVRLAWKVFTGEYDALKWEGQ